MVAGPVNELSVQFWSVRSWWAVQRVCDGWVDAVSCSGLYNAIALWWKVSVASFPVRAAVVRNTVRFLYLNRSAAPEEEIETLVSYVITSS